MTNTDKKKGATPRGPGKLDTLAGVRTEMGRLYRMALTGKMQPEKYSKLVYGLREIRECIERGLIADLQDRIDQLAAKVTRL